MYKAERLCQMHYFRRMRTGSFSKRESTRQHIRQNPRGYVLLYWPGHKLAQQGGYIYEHRKIMYDKYGEHLPPCELCGAGTSWAPYTTHIDHINGVVKDNRPDNLRVLCNACNTGRNRQPGHKRSGAIPITYNGLTLSAGEWSKMDGVNVTSNTIKRRLRGGASVREALYGEKITHKNAKRHGRA
jgi:HNH endonuclease